MSDSCLETCLENIWDDLCLRDLVLWNDGKPTKVEEGILKRTLEVGTHAILLLVDGVLAFACSGLYATSALLSSVVDLTKKKTPLSGLEDGIVPADVDNYYATHGNEINDLTLPRTVKLFGIADSGQQTNEIGPDSPVPAFQTAESQWTRFNHQGGTIEGIKSPEDFKNFFVDHITNPKPFIDYLKRMGANSYRFPIEWSVVQRADGTYNEEAIQLYKNFIQGFKEAGIEPLVTLHHFVHPQWFEEKGGFTKLENVDAFVQHATHMIELFPEVTYWMTFNEPGIHAFSSYVLGDHPPGKSLQFSTDAQVMRNLCLAHCKVFKEIRDKQLPHAPRIGITHQWLNFVPLEGNGNLAERLFCKLSSATHYAIYNFFLTGKFSLNGVEFEMPKEEWEKYNGFLDFMGVQWYGYPRVKMGVREAGPHPGYKIQNWMGLTFGVTCPPGGAAQAFGPSFYPASLRHCLNKASKLKKKIIITEIGGDAANWEYGKAGFESTERNDKIRAIFSVLAVLKILKDYSEDPNNQQAPLIGVTYWTWLKDRQQEWNRGFGNTSLGIAEAEVDEQRRLVGVKDTPTSLLLAKVFKATQQQMDEMEETLLINAQ